MSKVREFDKTKDVQLTRNFSSKEFNCKCNYKNCKITLIDLDHVEELQKMRDKWNKPIKINSAYRCEQHNKAVGGSSKSRHKEGDATDISVKGLSPDKVADDCEHFSGLGKYSSFTHIDSRPTKARWDFRK